MERKRRMEGTTDDVFVWKEGGRENTGDKKYKKEEKPGNERRMERSGGRN